MPLKARFIQEIGTIAFLRIYWGNDCPNSMGGENVGCHDARVELARTDAVKEWKLGGKTVDYPDDRWPSRCDHCDTVAKSGAIRQVFCRKLYDNDSGSPEPGDLYWTDHLASENDGCIFHDNCDGCHLFAILPNGRQWDIDGRASNCTRPGDRTHRCWVRHGDPPDITVDKGKRGDDTCRAGAGSIGSGDYHGFLQGGMFT